MTQTSANFFSQGVPQSPGGPGLHRTKKSVLSCVTSTSRFLCRISSAAKQKGNRYCVISCHLLTESEMASKGRQSSSKPPPTTLASAISITDEARIITTATPPYKVIHTNKKWNEITGYKFHEIAGQTCAFLQGPQTQRAALEVLHAALRTNRRGQTILTNYKRDGTPFTNIITCEPIDGGMYISGKLKCVPISNGSVAPLRRTEAELERAALAPVNYAEAQNYEHAAKRVQRHSNQAKKHLTYRPILPICHTPILHKCHKPILRICHTPISPTPCHIYPFCPYVTRLFCPYVTRPYLLPHVTYTHFARMSHAHFCPYVTRLYCSYVTLPYLIPHVTYTHLAHMSQAHFAPMSHAYFAYMSHPISPTPCLLYTSPVSHVTLPCLLPHVS